MARHRCVMPADGFQPRYYFDYAASNPLRSEAALAMSQAAALVGNPSAMHWAGLETRQLLDRSRRAVAAAFEVKASEITFTSGATEANNLVIDGLLRPLLAGTLAAERPLLNIVASSLEHASVLSPLQRLTDEFGVELRLVPLTGQAAIDRAKLPELIDSGTVLVCLTAANNVLGSIQPLAEVSALVMKERTGRQQVGKRPNPLYMVSDAVQAVSWLALRPGQLGLDAMVFSGHKCGGPKGIGGFWLRGGLSLRPLQLGGGQEAGLRSGTENLPAIAGLAAALGQASQHREKAVDQARVWRQELIRRIVDRQPQIRALGPDSESNVLPATVFLHLPGTKGDELALKLDAAGFAVSAGSACDAGKRQAPAVLKAAYGATVGKWGGIRVSFGHLTTHEDVIALADAIAAVA